MAEAFRNQVHFALEQTASTVMGHLECAKADTVEHARANSVRKVSPGPLTLNSGLTLTPQHSTINSNPRTPNPKQPPTPNPKIPNPKSQTPIPKPQNQNAQTKALNQDLHFFATRGVPIEEGTICSNPG